MTQEERNTNVSVTTRCFCSLETASNIPREHSHAQQHDPLPPPAHHQRAPVSSILPSKSSLPMLLLFGGKHEL